MVGDTVTGEAVFEHMRQNNVAAPASVVRMMKLYQVAANHDMVLELFYSLRNNGHLSIAAWDIALRSARSAAELMELASACTIEKDALLYTAIIRNRYLREDLATIRQIWTMMEVTLALFFKKKKLCRRRKNKIRVVYSLRFLLA
jgi:hypothetical protein